MQITLLTWKINILNVLSTFILNAVFCFILSLTIAFSYLLCIDYRVTIIFCKKLIRYVNDTKLNTLMLGSIVFASKNG